MKQGGLVLALPLKAKYRPLAFKQKNWPFGQQKRRFDNIKWVELNLKLKDNNEILKIEGTIKVRFSEKRDLHPFNRNTAYTQVFDLNKMLF